MGMRIHGGGYNYASQSAQNTEWQQRRQNFDALAQAISSGDLASAKTAYGNITSQLPSGASVNPNSFLGKIGSALDASDLTTAQQVLASRRHPDQQQASANTTMAAPSTMNASGSVTATTAVSGATDASGVQGPRRHHHHHQADSGSSPAMALYDAVQSGDTSTAQSAMQTILADLQQVAGLGSLSNPNSSGTSGNSSLTSAVSAANNLLQNPDFKALEDAVSSGDAASMKSAWEKLVSGASSSSTASAPADTTTPTV